MFAQKRNAFTLVELVIVIAMIGILVAFAVPRFLDSTQSATNRGIEANIRQIGDLIKIAMANDLKNPTDESVEDIIEFININRGGVTYSGKVKDFGIVIKYSSSDFKYSGKMGYHTEPNSSADLKDSTKMNNGSLVEDAYFVHDFGTLK